MKRSALSGTGALALAAALAALPASAGAQTPAKSLLLAESFTGTEVSDPDFLSLGACLTAATASGGQNDFDSCAEQDTGPVPEPGDTPGYLQLTDAGLYDTGAVVYNRALRREGDIEVTFAQYQYGGTGADGISFFLVDGDTDLTSTGAFGGSLGYAQHGENPGVEGAYLGLGLDAWGNFSADTEGRGTGCPDDQRAPEELRVALNRAPDNVALRGPGSGTEGYCLIATTATDEVVGEDGPSLLYGTDFPESLRTETLAGAKRLVKLKITDDDKPKVTVDLKFFDGSGWIRVLEARMPEAAPETFKFGFAASTGGATDAHLIRHLRVETFR